ncbi:General substrate transporter [marine actinobacterium PHSC20C1]|nr:General substrate transporter [marine actinobacterium PHSC20C1]
MNRVASGGAADGENPAAPKSRGGLLIVTLTLAMATGATGTYTLGALSPFIVSEFSLGAGGIGVLISALYVTAASFSGIIGRRADRVDPAFIILAGACCSLIAAVVFAVAPNVAVLVVFALFAGLAMAASNPGSNGMIARRLPPGSRAYATGLKQSGATGTGLYIAGVMPTLAIIVGWRGAALAAAVIPMLAIIAVLWSRRGQTNELDLDAVPDAIEHPRQSRWLLWLSAYALVLGIATGICNAFYVLYSSERLGFTVVEAGFVFASFGVASVIARVVWARLAERGLDTGRLLAIIAVIGAVSALLCLAAPYIGGWAMWTAAVFAGSSIVGWNALAMVTIMKRVPVNAVGASSARMLRAFFIGLAIGPLLFGGLVELTNYLLGWILQFAALGLALVFAILFGRALHSRTSREVAL